DHCVKLITEEQKEGLDLNSWTIAYNGAEPVRAETLDRFTAAFIRCGFRPQAFLPCYGLAESTLFVSGGPPDRHATRIRISGPSLEQHRLSDVVGSSYDAKILVSSGLVAAGTQVAIVDPTTFMQCQPGTVGEIWLASASVAEGYWDYPAETQESFRARPADT